MLMLLIALLASPGLPEPTFENYIDRGDCLWQAAPADAREAVEAAKDFGAFAEARNEFFQPRIWSQMTEACGMTEEPADSVAGMLFAPFSAMRWLEPRLEKRWPREMLRGAYARLSDDETGLIWGYAMGGERNWPEDRKILAQAALAKLYGPFGQSMNPPDQFSELDQYLLAELMISVIVLDIRAVEPGDEEDIIEP